MNPDPNSELDSPPQFRPWSPTGQDGERRRNVQVNNGLSDQGHSRSFMPSGYRQQRREASEVSVEALDLADYARTLRTRQAGDHYPPFPSSIVEPKPHYPPSASLYIPQPGTSRTSIAIHPPSLVSQGQTSSSPQITPSSAPSHSRRTAPRPYSLPPTPNNSSQRNGSARGGLNRNRQDQDPYIVDTDGYPSPDEIDISRFPKWSRGWYDLNNSHVAAQPDDVYTPIPPSLFGSPKNKTTFDPGYTYHPYSPYDVPPPFSPEPSRNLLPWSSDPPEYGPALNPILKEERIRMLEREFGKNKDTDIFDDDVKPKVGSVDEKGNLVTSGPKRRILFRVLEIILAVGACVPAIYASLVIKPPDPNDPPPPANKPPIFVLYILSSLTLVLLLYLFLIRPCCIVRIPPSTANPSMNNGMMVLPVTGRDAKKEQNKGKNKYQGPGRHGDVQVNLIVDPEMFHPPDADTSDDDEDEDENGEDSRITPGRFRYEERERARRKKKRRNRRRRGLLEGLRLEEQWKVARSWAKKITAVDVAGLVLWGAEFVYILFGPRCPSGTYNGWCNAYNVSTASACLLALAFSVSLFHDVQDLHASKQSPRTRN